MKTFIDIYEAVDPPDHPDAWTPEEKRHVVSVAKKTTCVDTLLTAMGLEPKDWSVTGKAEIAKALFNTNCTVFSHPPDPIAKIPVNRPVRPDPRTFRSFPEEATCPICGTNDDGTTVLVAIAGTTKGSRANAKPMHLSCAVVREWDDLLKMAFMRPDSESQ